MISIGTTTLRGHGDKLYTFQVYDWNVATGNFEGLPSEGGIFFVGSCGKEQKLDDIKVAWIKMALSLSDYPLFDAPLKCLKEQGADCVGFMPVPHNDRNDVLMELVVTNEPVCNGFKQNN